MRSETPQDLEATRRKAYASESPTTAGIGTSLLDESAIDIACPKCARKRKEKIGKLKTNPKLTCLGCGTVIQIEADEIRKAIDQVDRSLADLKRSLGKLGKR